MFWDGMLVDHWCVIEFAAQLGRMYSQPGGILRLVFIPYKIEGEKGLTICGFEHRLRLTLEFITVE